MLCDWFQDAEQSSSRSAHTCPATNHLYNPTVLPSANVNVNPNPVSTCYHHAHINPALLHSLTNIVYTDATATNNPVTVNNPNALNSNTSQHQLVSSSLASLSDLNSGMVVGSEERAGNNARTASGSTSEMTMLVETQQRLLLSSLHNKLPRPVVSPFSAPMSALPNNKVAAAIPLFKVGRLPVPQRHHSRFSVRAPLSSTFLPPHSPSSAHAQSSLTSSTSLPSSQSVTSLTLTHAHTSPPPASVVTYQMPSPSYPLAPPADSQSVSMCASQPGPGGGQRWPIKSKSLGNINERTVPAYQVSRRL